MVHGGEIVVSPHYHYSSMLKDVQAADITAEMALTDGKALLEKGAVATNEVPMMIGCMIR
jgi:hypothetical protein